MKTPQMTWEEAVLHYRSLPDNSEAILACYYDDPLSVAAERYFNSPEFIELMNYVPGDLRRVLDLGAGRGISSYSFARSGFDVVALEPNPSNIVGSGAIRALATEAHLDISVTENWGEKLPFENASFDVVHGRAVMHHAINLVDFCEEVARVLRPGGRFIAIRDHVISSDADKAEFFKRHPLHSLYGGENAYTIPEYRHAIERAGLKIIKILNPWSSAINLHPDTYHSLRRKIGKALHLPFPLPLSDKMLSLLGNYYHAPGRLYSFVSVKAGN